MMVSRHQRRGARCPVDIGIARTKAEVETQRSGQVKMTSVLHSHLRSLCCWHRRRKVIKMGLFKKKGVVQSYDKENKKPVIKASICNGEQVAGFKDIHTGKIEEVMLIKSPADLEYFKAMYGIDEEITKEY